MSLYNGLTACLGLLLASAPWWTGTSGHEPAVWTGITLGFLQLFASLSARGQSGWSSAPHWVSLLCGVAFLIFPFAFHLAWPVAILYIAGGYATVLLNYASMNRSTPSP
ncbi:hypothetical protein SAMN02799630_04477 [Paenibacillus sp. UNCCL117]|uniref:SPW repeat domain-containing protein n=1 Tax=unclassified Paenibacillus TaxID=185978 RepID=UPI000881F5D5|nr:MULTISPECIES: hypothetical protein [unclassified Paenibacillus]SDE03814.1 hypothetical protein SAMN04488602_11786 [Paenibacillus sp. cl123]SFW57488.1 hypothetical protein SAMN02799630_04477 [Paenibacillus sp. UNCCL117]